ncbi:hypothetical protein [Streptomyces sp. NPDC060184]|uniref:hypothetical protein n=1 Tax=Streptomyces sp. NPDC060184 TaxID=3347064 RepID=UPI00365F6973
MAYARADWSAHFSEGRGLARLGDEEKRLLAEHVPAPEGGAVVVITPVADAATPGERRPIALDEDELGLLADGFEETARFDAAGLAFLVLRRPVRTFRTGSVFRAGSACRTFHTDSVFRTARACAPPAPVAPSAPGGIHA